MVAETSSGFRPDINGLRALSVCAVVFFHFKVPFFGGGFVGVDVFFVISGFLMTQIILGPLTEGRFRLADFYGSRVRRIIPALVVATSIVLLVQIACLDGMEVEAGAKGALASLLMVSNLYFKSLGGYFAAPPEQNWFLHTWSLSVEWQFYLLYPLLLLGVVRLSLPRRPSLTCLMIASFMPVVIAAHTGGGALQASFFTLTTRAWEMIAGGLVQQSNVPMRLSGPIRRGMHIAGLLAILGSVFLISGDTGWPTAMTAVPVAGAALVIMSGVRRPAWADFPATRAVGRWSYSIYLWHWPIVAFIAANGLHPRFLTAVVGIAASVCGGAVSFALVETRLTRWLWRSPGWPWAIGLPLYVAIVATALLLVQTNGLETIRFRGDPVALATLHDLQQAHDDWAFPAACDHSTTSPEGIELCQFGDPKARDVLVIGDSMAQQLAPRYAHAFDSRSGGITFATRAGCVPGPGYTRYQPAGWDCGGWQEKAYAFAAHQKFKRVVVVTLWSILLSPHACYGDVAKCPGETTEQRKLGARRTLDLVVNEWRAVADVGTRVFVLEMIPYGPGNPQDLYKAAASTGRLSDVDLDRGQFERQWMDLHSWIDAAARKAGATAIDPSGALCPDDRCPVVRGGRALFKDSTHLRASMMKDARFSALDGWFGLSDDHSSAVR